MSNVVSLKPDSSEPQPPSSVEIEQALLGALLIHNPIYPAIASIIDDGHFIEPTHQMIWRAAVDMIAAKQTASPITLAPYLPKEIVPGVTSAAYLARLAAEALPPGLAAEHARTIRNLAMRRSLLDAGLRMRERAQQGRISDDPFAMAGDAIGTLQRIIESDDKADKSTLGEAIVDMIGQADAQRSGRSITAISTGFSDVDRMLRGGYRPGRLIVMAGRPGMGKTAVAVASARRVAHKGNGVAIFSLEIDRSEQAARLVASHMARGNESVSPSYGDILTGNVDDVAFQRVQASSELLRDYPIEIDATTNLSMVQIEARSKIIKDRMARKGQKLGVVFIDYLGLVRAGDTYRGRKVDELGEIVLAAKNMSKRLDVCVVMLAQLSRAVEQRDDKRPVISDLRDSGNIEEHADAVLLLYRPAYYDQQSGKEGDIEAMQRSEERKNDLTLFVPKNRLGMTGSVDLFCDVARCCIDQKTWH